MNVGDKLVSPQVADGRAVVIVSTSTAANGNRLLTVQTADGRIITIQIIMDVSQGDHFQLIQTADGRVVPFKYAILPGDVLWGYDFTLIGDGYNVIIDDFSQEYMESIHYPCGMSWLNNGTYTERTFRFYDGYVWYFGYASNSYVINWNTDTEQWEETEIPSSEWAPGSNELYFPAFMKWGGEYGTARNGIEWEYLDYRDSGAGLPEGLSSSIWTLGNVPFDRYRNCPDTGNAFDYDAEFDRYVCAVEYIWIVQKSDVDKYRSYGAVFVRDNSTGTWTYDFTWRTETWTSPAVSYPMYGVYAVASWKSDTYLLLSDTGDAVEAYLYKNGTSIYTYDADSASEFMKTSTYIWFFDQLNTTNVFRHDGTTTESITLPTVSGASTIDMIAETYDGPVYLMVYGTKSVLYRWNEGDDSWVLVHDGMDATYEWTGRYALTGDRSTNWDIADRWDSISRNGRDTAGVGTGLYFGEEIRGPNRYVVYAGSAFSAITRDEQTEENTDVADRYDPGSILNGDPADITGADPGANCSAIGDVFCKVTESGGTYTLSMYISDNDRAGQTNRVAYVTYTGTGTQTVNEDNGSGLSGDVNINQLATDNDLVLTLPTAGRLWRRPRIRPGTEYRYRFPFVNGELKTPIVFDPLRTYGSPVPYGA